MIFTSPSRAPSLIHRHFNRDAYSRLTARTLALALLLVTGCSTAPNPPGTFGTSPGAAQEKGARGPHTRLVLPGLIDAGVAYQKLLRLPANAPEADREALITEYDHGVESAGRRLMTKLAMSELSDRLYVRAAEDKTKVFRLNFDAEGRGDPYWPASSFTGVEFAADVKGDRGARAQTSGGLGVPIVLKREYTEEAGKSNPTLPLNGIHQPATVVLEYSGKNNEQGVEDIYVRLYDSRGLESVPIGTKHYKPAEDLSAAIALSMQPHFWFRFAWLGFFNPAKQLDNAGEGLYALEPYDPNKIPVVFVHGLRSDPHIWKNAMNTILEDREVAKRYQMWYYLYPTGLPIPTAAASFRKSLRTTQQHFDPDGNDPGLNNTVIVGHSMGGLLARLQSTESGMDFWNANFKKPPAELQLWRTDKKALEDSLIFDPVPFVKRDIYIATPHRGSKVATWGPVDWILSLVKRPDGLVEVAKNFATVNTDALQPELANFRRFGTTGVDTLSPDYPFFKVLDKKPILVPFHSIIANIAGDAKTGTDGIVPYSSSHLEGAQSELIEPGWHGCVEAEATCDEIDRILRLHAKLPPRRKPKVAAPSTGSTAAVAPTPEGRSVNAGLSSELNPNAAAPKEKPKRQPSSQVWKR